MKSAMRSAKPLQLTLEDYHFHFNPKPRVERGMVRALSEEIEARNRAKAEGEMMGGTFGAINKSDENGNGNGNGNGHGSKEEAAESKELAEAEARAGGAKDAFAKYISEDAPDGIDEAAARDLLEGDDDDWRDADGEIE